MKQDRLLDRLSLSRPRNIEVFDSVVCVLVAMGFAVIAKTMVGSPHFVLGICAAGAAVSAFGLVVLGVTRLSLRISLSLLIAACLASFAIVLL